MAHRRRPQAERINDERDGDRRFFPTPNRPGDRSAATVIRMTVRPRKARSRRPTMNDVARAAGVSQTAVSFVLNDRPDATISEETRARIWQAVTDLGYRPNAMAQALRSGKSSLLGFVTDEIATTPFAGLIIRGAQDAAWAHHRILTLVNTDKRADLESEAIGALLKHQVEGIVFATMYHHEISLPAILGDVPIALSNCYCADSRVAAAVPDEERGGNEATRHLLERGHRDVAYVSNIDDIPATHGRLAGYRRALHEFGLPFREDRVRYLPSVQEGGYDAVMSLMRQSGERPTALFCFKDRMAMGAYAALQDLGLRIPQDISVVGFDNQELIAAHLRPPLTTLRLPHYEMGRWSVEALLGKVGTPSRTLIHCPLIERESVARVDAKQARARSVKDSST